MVIIFDAISSFPRARCVKYKDGNSLFRSTNEVCVKDGGRIYLAAGALYTPALLMKSGIKEGGKIYNNDQVRRFIHYYINLFFVFHKTYQFII